MVNYKKTIVFSLALTAFVNAAQADLSTTPQVTHTPTPSHTPTLAHTPVPAATPKMEVLTDNLVMSREEFMKNMPTETDKILPYVFDTLSLGESYAKASQTTYKVILTDSIPDGNILDIKPRFDKTQQLHFDFYLQKSLAKNPVYIMQVLNVLQTFLESSMQLTSHQKQGNWQYKTYHKDGVLQYAYHENPVIVHTMVEVTHSAMQLLGVNYSYNRDLPLSWAERKINADKGSVYAQREIKANQLATLKSSMNNFPNFKLIKNLTEDQKKDALVEMAEANKITLDTTATAENMAIEYFTKSAEILQAQVDDLTKQATIQNSKDKKYLDSAEVKTRKDKLEDMSLKLDDYVKANDREGAAKLLEGFLPFEIMEPMEKSMWKDWIEAIRHPDRENSKLMFRGLDKENDKPQIAYEGKTPKGYGFFSTLLSRNQGNYTRRLRSFVGMRYKFMNINRQETSPVEKAPSIVGMMIQHSQKPQGSPLLSFSTDPRVAYGFSTRGLIAVKMDPRRFMPNMVSGFTNELELLVPLIVFPDEIIHMEDYSNQGRPSYNDILARINTKLGHPYEQDIERDAKKMYLGAYKIFANAQGGLMGMCSRVFMK